MYYYYRTVVKELWRVVGRFTHEAVFCAVRYSPAFSQSVQMTTSLMHHRHVRCCTVLSAIGSSFTCRSIMSQRQIQYRLLDSNGRIRGKSPNSIGRVGEAPIHANVDDHATTNADSTSPGRRGYCPLHEVLCSMNPPLCPVTRAARVGTRKFINLGLITYHM
jgi:hypothetical protein